jgi:hypothetical protein
MEIALRFEEDGVGLISQNPRNMGGEFEDLVTQEPLQVPEDGTACRDGEWAQLGKPVATAGVCLSPASGRG